MPVSAATMLYYNGFGSGLGAASRQNIESSLILNRASSSAASAANSGDLWFGGIDVGACGFESVLLNLVSYLCPTAIISVT